MVKNQSYTLADIKELTGLHLRPTYEQLVDYIERDPVKLPTYDRNAIKSRNSMFGSALDGEGNRIVVDIERMRLAQEQKDYLIRRFADDFGFFVQDLRVLLDRFNLVPVSGPPSAPASDFEPLTTPP